MDRRNTLFIQPEPPQRKGSIFDTKFKPKITQKPKKPQQDDDFSKTDSPKKLQKQDTWDNNEPVSQTPLKPKNPAASLNTGRHSFFAMSSQFITKQRVSRNMLGKKDDSTPKTNQQGNGFYSEQKNVFARNSEVNKELEQTASQESLRQTRKKSQMNNYAQSWRRTTKKKRRETVTEETQIRNLMNVLNSDDKRVGDLSIFEERNLNGRKTGGSGQSSTTMTQGRAGSKFSSLDQRTSLFDGGKNRMSTMSDTSHYADGYRDNNLEAYKRVSYKRSSEFTKWAFLGQYNGHILVEYRHVLWKKILVSAKPFSIKAALNTKGMTQKLTKKRS